MDIQVPLIVKLHCLRLLAQVRAVLATHGTYKYQSLTGYARVDHSPARSRSSIVCLYFCGLDTNRGACKICGVEVAVLRHTLSNLNEPTLNPPAIVVDRTL